AIGTGRREHKTESRREVVLFAELIAIVAQPEIKYEPAVRNPFVLHESRELILRSIEHAGSRELDQLIPRAVFAENRDRRAVIGAFVGSVTEIDAGLERV